MRCIFGVLLVLFVQAAVASEAQNRDKNWLTYYRGAEKFGGDQWQRDIWPRIASFANLSRVLELASGGGRLTAALLRTMRSGDSLIGVDKNRVAVETLLRPRFASYINGTSSVRAAFFSTNGSAVPMVADGSISFVFSWDSMVHFSPTDVASYVVDIARVLRPGGTGFLHHSNLPVCTGNATRGKAKGPKKSCGVPIRARKNPHGRNVMTCEIFARLATAAGLQMISSEHFLWPPEPEQRLKRGALIISDCLSSFRKPTNATHDMGNAQPLRGGRRRGGGSGAGARGGRRANVTRVGDEGLSVSLREQKAQRAAEAAGGAFVSMARWEMIQNRMKGKGRDEGHGTGFMAGTLA